MAKRGLGKGLGVLFGEDVTQEEIDTMLRTREFNLFEKRQKKIKQMLKQMRRIFHVKHPAQNQ